MGSLFETVFLCGAIEMAIVWVLRRRTELVRRVGLERLLYTTGVDAAVTQPIVWILAPGVSSHLGLALGLFLLQLGAFAVGVPVFSLLGRIGWRRGILFAFCTHTGALFVLLVLAFSGTR